MKNFEIEMSVYSGQQKGQQHSVHSTKASGNTSASGNYYESDNTMTLSDPQGHCQTLPDFLIEPLTYLYKLSCLFPIVLHKI